MASEQEIVAEVEVLKPAVGRDRRGEPCMEHPPRLATFRPWLPLQ
jgi:hypothetical protein